MGKMSMKRGLNTLGDSYYLQIGKVKYDRALFNELKKIDTKGKCTEAQARAVWRDVLDGPVLPTATEIRTLRYGLRNYKFEDAARAFLLSKLPASSGDSSAMKSMKKSMKSKKSMKAAAPVPMKSVKKSMSSMKMKMKSVMKMKSAPKMKSVMKSAPAPMKSMKAAAPAMKKAAPKRASTIDYIKKIFKKADVNRDGQLTLKEFKDAATSGNKKKKLITAHVAKVGKKNNFNTIKM